MISTIYGDQDEATLDCKTGTVDNANEFTSWIEYYDKTTGELVHRSAHVTVKQGASSGAIAGSIG